MPNEIHRNYPTAFTSPNPSIPQFPIPQSLHFPPQLLDLSLDPLILLGLGLQKPNGHSGLFLNSLGGEFVEVGGFSVGVLEVDGLDAAFFNEGTDAEIDSACGKPDLLRQVALGLFRLFRDVLEKVIGVRIGEVLF
jgi:hypothetical protein